MAMPRPDRRGGTALRSLRLSVRTPPFHGGESGSIPLGSASNFSGLTLPSASGVQQVARIRAVQRPHPAPWGPLARSRQNAWAKPAPGGKQASTIGGGRSAPAPKDRPARPKGDCLLAQAAPGVRPERRGRPAEFSLGRRS
jgi:hypothetical protein